MVTLNHVLLLATKQELMGELDALDEMDVGEEEEVEDATSVPTYLQQSEDMPSAPPRGQPSQETPSGEQEKEQQQGSDRSQKTDAFGLPLESNPS